MLLFLKLMEIFLKQHYLDHIWPCQPSPRWLTEDVSAWRCRSKCSQTHDSPHGWLALNWTEVLGWGVPKSMKCSFWSFIIHESYLVFRAHLKWRKSPNTINAGRASPEIAAVAPSHKNSGSFIYSWCGDPAALPLMWCWWHQWPGGLGKDMVEWLAALSQEPAQVPCLSQGNFYILCTDGADCQVHDLEGFCPTWQI